MIPVEHSFGHVRTGITSDLPILQASLHICKRTQSATICTVYGKDAILESNNMNIVMIMSGGVGRRFGSLIPKQYSLIAGRPVIDYVIDAVKQSKQTDQVVVVMDKKWNGYSKLLSESGFAMAPNGDTRFESMRSGLNLIKENFNCEKLVIVDAVAPFLKAELIDYYFEQLDEYDAVITAQKITGGFTDKNNTPLDREDFIITQSPEGFHFEQLYSCFDVNYPYQETACMLPAECKRLYYYGFKNNLKLTYDFELEYAEFALARENRLKSDISEPGFNIDIFFTEGLRSYLLRNEYEKTMNWLNQIYTAMPRLIDQWKITSFVPAESSRFGLVLLAKSQTYGECAIKFIPEFVGRYERELEAMRILPESYMCRLYDSDESVRAMLLERIADGTEYARFEDQDKLKSFFTHVLNDAVACDRSRKLEHIPLYYEELCGKLDAIDTVPYLRDEVRKELELAIADYQKVFADEKLYILHGDLHELNTLDSGKRWYGIDPNGMLAPVELECVRFIRNDVRSHSGGNYKERFNMTAGKFAEMCDLRKLIFMFIIDMAFCTYNSTFENETPEETLVDLELIRIARDYQLENSIV